MTTEPSSTLRKTVRIASVFALIALSGSLLGCTKADDAQAAVKQAGRTFSSIAAGDPMSYESFSKQSYLDTEQLVRDYAGDENGYAEAAAVSLSLAKLGQASLASQEASAAETRALQQARVVRGMINEWYTMSAISKAAGQFDPSAEINDIEHLISQRREDVKAYEAQRDEVESRIADLDGRITDLRSKADAQRNESGGLELQMPRVSATEAARIVQQVREHTLRADQFELEAQRLDGVVGQLRPGAREISLNVEKAASQIELLQDARRELEARLESSRKDAQQAQQAAAKASSRIKRAVDEYEQFRDDKVQSANQRAISLVNASISALRDANNATKQIASLTKASAQQTLAECHARQANGYAEAAILYQALGETGVEGDWNAGFQQAQQAQAESEQAADEAYQNAASSLRGARVKGEPGEKLEATAVRLEQLAGIAPEPGYDESTDAASDTTDTTMDGALDDEAQPQSGEDASADGQSPEDDG